MYEASVTFHQGSERENGYEENFATLKEAVEQIEHWVKGMGPLPRAWINNKEVTIQAGRVVDQTGEPLCTNEKWHEIFAKTDEQIKPLA
jgi:methionyl-tRNA formyltransferase